MFDKGLISWQSMLCHGSLCYVMAVLHIFESYFLWKRTGFAAKLLWFYGEKATVLCESTRTIER